MIEISFVIIFTCGMALSSIYWWYIVRVQKLNLYTVEVSSGFLHYTRRYNSKKDCHQQWLNPYFINTDVNLKKKLQFDTNLGLQSQVWR